MKIKQTIKHMIGQERIDYYRGVLRYYTEKKSPNQRVIIAPSFLNSKKMFDVVGENLFSGYYDIDPLSKDGNTILAQKIPLRANTKHSKTCIGTIDIQTGQFTEVAESNAWSWQQGSRVRWSNNPNCIYYNDVINRKDCTILYDIHKKRILNVFDRACYDIAPDESFGISLDFARLQRLRPGYGYSVTREISKSPAPDNDGIYKVDFKNNSIKLLISLSDLAQITDPELKSEHYINHISISPDSRKFLFFHIRTSDEVFGRKVNLCVMDSDGSNLRSFGENFLSSHYTWISNEELIITCVENDCSQTYRLLNVNTLSSRVLNPNILKEDGHPTVVLSNWIITDTYPNPLDLYQTLYIHDIENGLNIEIAKLYADPRRVGEKRCDLHPKISIRGEDVNVFVDTTCNDGKRSILRICIPKSVFIGGV